MKEYDLYLFDFDNTLFDTRHGIEVLLEHALPALGMHYERSMFARFLGMNIDQIFHSCCSDSELYDGYRQKVDEVIFSDAYVGAIPFPDAKETLLGLKEDGKHIGIVSGKAKFKIETLLDSSGLAHIPEIIVGWNETVRHKPDPEPISFAFSYFDVPKDRTIYVGDSPNDSVASSAFGLDCAIVDRKDGTSPGGTACTWALETLTELLDHSRSE